jgi:hypothetical protein
MSCFWCGNFRSHVLICNACSDLNRNKDRSIGAVALLFLCRTLSLSLSLSLLLRDKQYALIEFVCARFFEMMANANGKECVLDSMDSVQANTAHTVTVANAAHTVTVANAAHTVTVANTAHTVTVANAAHTVTVAMNNRKPKVLGVHSGNLRHYLKECWRTNLVYNLRRTFSCERNRPPGPCMQSPRKHTSTISSMFSTKGRRKNLSVEHMPECILKTVSLGDRFRRP